MILARRTGRYLAGADVDRIACVGVCVEILADRKGRADPFSREYVEQLLAIRPVHGQAAGGVLVPRGDAERSGDDVSDIPRDGLRLPGARVDRAEAILAPKRNCVRACPGSSEGPTVQVNAVEGCRRTVAAFGSFRLDRPLLRAAARPHFGCHLVGTHRQLLGERKKNSGCSVHVAV